MGTIVGARQAACHGHGTQIRGGLRPTYAGQGGAADVDSADLNGVSRTQLLYQPQRRRGAGADVIDALRPGTGGPAQR